MKKLIFAMTAVFSLLAFLNLSSAFGMQEETDSSDCNRIYVFKEYNGSVACFEKDGDYVSEEPFLTTDIRVRDLTPVDRTLLSEGVETYGARAMSRILEDLDR